MDFQKPLFWNCFIIVMKINFIVFHLNLIPYDSARYFEPIRNNIPIEIESIANFETFNTEIRKWKPKNC